MACSVQIIFSFEKIPPQIATINVNRKSSERQFLIDVFNSFADSELNLLNYLSKMSCCQIIEKKEDKEDLFNFLLWRNGKFYFNSRINHDDDTIRLREFLNNYLIVRKGKINSLTLQG